MLLHHLQASGLLRNLEMAARYLKYSEIRSQAHLLPIIADCTDDVVLDNLAKALYTLMARMMDRVFEHRNGSRTSEGPLIGLKDLLEWRG
jgi:hypothetical protein